MAGVRTDLQDFYYIPCEHPFVFKTFERLYLKMSSI